MISEEKTMSWIVTLDVLKYTVEIETRPNIMLNSNIRCIEMSYGKRVVVIMPGWIVTLDVLKSNAIAILPQSLIMLNSNIRCIEILRLVCRIPLLLQLNSNIRCIEMLQGY